MNEWMAGWQEEGVEKSEAKQIEIKVGGMKSGPQATKTQEKCKNFPPSLRKNYLRGW